MTFLTDIDKIDIHKWGAFIKNHPQGNFYQSYEFFKAIVTDNSAQAVIIILSENNEYLGVLIAQIQEEKLGPLSFLSRRAIIQGGPLVKDNRIDLTELIISKYIRLVKRKVVYSQIRNLFDQEFIKSTLLKHKFYFEDHLNIIIDLTHDEGKLWSDVHSKRRNEIRKATKVGTTFDIASTETGVSETYHILREVYQRANLPLPKKKFFESMLKSLGSEIFKVFVAKNDNKIIGTMYTFCYKDRIIDWYAGALSEFYNMYPNDLIPWEVFLWGKKNGFSVFDFGGAGKPNIPYGVRDYKKRFGGTLVNFGRFEKIHRLSIYRFSSWAFAFLRKYLFKCI